MTTAKYIHPDILDNGLNHPAARATAGDTLKVHLLKAYTLGDSYATCVGNSVGSNLVALTSGDFAVADGTASLSRKLTVASKSLMVSASGGTGGSPNLHLALLDETSSKVFLVVPAATPTEVIAQGVARQIDAAVFTINQPS